jgi:hypothetical protein
VDKAASIKLRLTSNAHEPLCTGNNVRIKYIWRDLHWVGWMSRCDSGGGSESGEKGFGSVALRQVIEKALPLPLPDTLVMPSQRATERTPEMGIEEDVVNTNGSQGVRSEDTNANSV